MFMGEKYSPEFPGIQPATVKTLHQLPGGNPCIHQNGIGAVPDVITVSVTSGG